MRRDRGLSAEERMDARAALALLDGTGLSLQDCVRVALQLPGGSPVAAVPMDQAIDQFLRAKKAAGRRTATLDYYQQYLWAYQERSGIQGPAQATTANIRSYLASLAGSRPQAYRALRAFLRWCADQDPPLARPVNMPPAGPDSGDGNIGYLSPADALRLLEWHQYRYPIAVGLFAGVRMGELSRLDWSAIHQADRVIRISAKVSKTGRARVLEHLPETIWHWLEGAPASGPVLPVKPVNFTKALKRRLPNYPKNALRHSFATYHVAAFRDPGSTALLLGHEGGLQLLYTRYRGIASEAEAKEFWSLKPRNTL